MNWTVETLNDSVDAELDALAPTFKAKFLHIAEMLESLGPHRVREPYVKHLEDKLWEIRMKAQPGIARAIYVTVKGQRIIILHAFVKKTQKTPRAALDIARQRMKEAGV
ncbi:type II toxin-antitoxin system RelE/ParE family toxin [Mariprofundus sp. KV]|uniref:type II toxin-antitoxin system RelE/ParE family toxin n=1 Tax=Mariprofundus sp. KV TaxID=2608715 RepID=UPI0015A304C7|nr:type II toxin-antitoxin system RelE/ParE family toxin [Mariprofundus sp. KV]NWF36872.1 type II toxin-antitoxin system RelE/ParE family toxin [Mariprofundus sp. KV]